MTSADHDSDFQAHVFEGPASDEPDEIEPEPEESSPEADEDDFEAHASGFG